MSDPEISALMVLLRNEMARTVKGSVGRFMTREGKLKLRGVPIAGPLPKGGGGTSNTWGFADHGHSGATDGQQLAEANTHQSLDTAPATAIHWSREMLQDMIATFLVDELGDPFPYNDAGNLLTIAAAGALADLTDVALTALAAEDVLVYRGGVWTNGISLRYWAPVTNGDPINPEFVFDDGDVVMDIVEP